MAGFPGKSAQWRQFQTGLPFSSRRTSVSFPFTTSRARVRSTSPCLTFEPVRTTPSPLLKLTPRSTRKDCGHRYTSTVSVPVFSNKWAISFSLPLGGIFTSSTVPFIFASVWRSYLGRLGSRVFCASRGAAHRNARKAARNRILHERLDRSDLFTSAMAPSSTETLGTEQLERQRRVR